MRNLLRAASLVLSAGALVASAAFSVAPHHTEHRTHGRATIACTEKGFETTYPDNPHPHNKFELTPNPHSCGDLTRARIGCAYATGVPHSPVITVFFHGKHPITKAGQISRAYCQQEPSASLEYADWSGWQLKFSGKWHTVCVWRYHLRCPKG